MLYGSLVLASEENVDITEQVVEELKNTTVEFDPLPLLFIALPDDKGESKPSTAGLISIL
ncbi:TPA: hypothetical protein ACIJWR_004549 [Citrobacter sedlakii]|uniref:hypothetical protein n=1 Tax=Citrobacter sedlakii TaxID=67826 RepID=UPI00333D7891|nr:hypothetical protein [Citrobacter sedlakii]